MYVDFHLFGFTVYFGDSPDAPAPLPWAAFLDLIQQPGPVISPADTPDNQDMTRLHITLADGSFPSPKGPQSKDEGTAQKGPSTDATTVWRVRAGDFAFQVGCDVAVRTFEVNEDSKLGSQGWNATTGNFYDPHTDITAQNVGVTSNPFAKPMQITDPTIKPTPLADPKSGAIPPTPPPDSSLPVSHLIVTIDMDNPKKSEADDMGNEPKKWLITPIIKNLPLGLWGPYNTASDPLKSGNNVDTSLDASPFTVPLCTGVLIHAPKPVLSQDKIPKFKVEECSFADVNGEADDDPNLPATPTVQTDFAPSKVADDASSAASATAAWESTALSWATAGKAEIDTVQALVDECAVFLGWDQPTAAQVAEVLPVGGTVAGWKAMAPWRVMADVPGRLVEDGFGGGEFALALPMVSVGWDGRAP